MATLDQIKSVLYGTETSNRPDKIFAASFAVPDKFLGKQFGRNYSSVSFGSNQLTSSFQNDPNSIFNPTSADYHTAVAAMIAAYNRNPSLANRLVTNLEQHVRLAPDPLSTRELTTAPDIEQLGELYRRLYDGGDPGGWNLITTYGASNLRDGVTVPDQWSAP